MYIYVYILSCYGHQIWLDFDYGAPLTVVFVWEANKANQGPYPETTSPTLEMSHSSTKSLLPNGPSVAQRQVLRPRTREEWGDLAV